MQIASIITPAMTRREARSALKKAGWTFVGGGSFATVYASPDGSVVAKVTKPDAGASAFYRLARKHPDNPHLPRYAGRIPLGSRASRGYVYEVERLSRWDEDNDYWQIEQDAQEGEATYWAARDLISEAIDASRSRSKWLDDDFGMSNAMHRNGTFVFTDPLYAEDDLSRSYRGRGRSNPDNSGYDEDPDLTTLPLELAA